MKRTLGLTSLGIGLIVLAGVVALFQNELSGIGSIAMLVSLVAGAAVLGVGWRGRPRLSTPRCAKCKYDLRGVLGAQTAEEPGNCPECGADLAGRDAVHFGRYRARPRVVTAGAGLILLPVLWFAWLALPGFFGVIWQWDEVKPAGWLVADLRTTVDEPWTWQKLERRYRRGNLTQAEVGRAVGVLAQHLRQQRAAGQPREPLHWAGSFLRITRKAGDVSPKRYQQLCRAYYSGEPTTLNVPKQARADQPIEIKLGVTPSWTLDGTKLWFALREIRVAGSGEALRPVGERISGPPGPGDDDALSLSTSGSWDITAVLRHGLPRGKHELVFTFDLAVVDQSQTPRGRHGKPGQASKWQNSWARWTRELRRTIQVGNPPKAGGP